MLILSGGVQPQKGEIVMANKVIVLLFLNLGIVCFLSSCAVTQESSSTNTTKVRGPYFLPRSISGSEDSVQNRDNIYDFLNDNVIGRTVSQPVSDGTMNNGQQWVRFGATGTYSNLQKTKRGLIFDIHWKVIHRVHDLDSQGRKVGEERVFDREHTTRCEVRQAVTTGEVVGYGHTISPATSGDIDFTGSVGLVRFTLSDGKLIYESVNGHYSDHIAPGGWKTAWGTSEGAWEIEDGKLKFSYLTKSYPVGVNKVSSWPSTNRYSYTEVTDK